MYCLVCDKPATQQRGVDYGVLVNLCDMHAEKFDVDEKKRESALYSRPKEPY